MTIAPTIKPHFLVLAVINTNQITFFSLLHFRSMLLQWKTVGGRVIKNVSRYRLLSNTKKQQYAQRQGQSLQGLHRRISQVQGLGFIRHKEPLDFCTQSASRYQSKPAYIQITGNSSVLIITEQGEKKSVGKPKIQQKNSSSSSIYEVSSMDYDD